MIALLAGVLALSGCGTVSKADCQSGDWRAIGLADGRAGEPANRIDDHGKSCARYGLPVDAPLWESGRQEGLRAYCTPASGWSAGVAGSTYRNVCPPAVEGDFLTAYGLGGEVHRARADARGAAEEARRTRSDRDRADDRIDDLRRRLERTDDPEERAEIRDRIAEVRLDSLGDFGDVLRAEREADAAAREADITEARARSTFAALFGAAAP